MQALQEQQGTERSNLINPQSARSFGGDRSGLVAAELARKQALGTSQAMAPIFQQGYDKAIAAAQQQQGVGLAAQQANLARLGQAGAQFGQLGTGAQQAGLAGAQAQLGAGQVEQQTQQAGLQALYNQFMQQQAYPFQVSQFLSNIATGTGALSGNTTTANTTGGGGFFSDERLKENIEKVGETNDGQNIYRYNYKGDPRLQIGLLAQEVAKDHPEAVGQRDGYLTVDYRDATNDAVREHKAGGGDIGTSAYDIAAPSAMMGASPVTQEMLAGLATKPMAGLGGLSISPSATAPGAAGILAPKATGLSPGSIEGAQAELASLQGANLSKSQLGSSYFDQQKQKLQDFLAANNASSQGGLVAAPGRYSAGGYAEGGYMNPALQFYGQQGGKSGLGAGGPYGAQLTPAQVQALKAAELMKPPQQKSGIEQANQIANMALKGNDAWKARPDFLRTKEDIAAREKVAQAANAHDEIAIAQAKGLAGSGVAPSPSTNSISTDPNATVTGLGRRADIDTNTLFAAHGGLIVREHHANLGPVGGGTPYSTPDEENLVGDALTAAPQKHEMMQPGKIGQPAPQPTGAQQFGQAAGQAKSFLDKSKDVYNFAAKKLAGEAAPKASGLAAGSTEAAATPIAQATAAPVAEGLTAAAPIVEGATVAAPVAEGLAAGAAGAAEGAGLLGSLASGAAAAGEGIMAALPFFAAIFSDERMKHDIERVGELNDGQPVYRFKYNGDDKTRMGLMAQDVEKDHPEAVKGLGGVKMVDYKRATNDAARQHHADGERVMDTGEAPQDGDFLSKLASTFSDAGETVTGLGKKLVENVPTKDTFWVPAIAGLGSMLASPNKTLAGAIGSGLVGGATTYEGMQKQNALELKQRLDMAKGMFTGPEIIDGKKMYNNTYTGQWVPEAEMLRQKSLFSGAGQLGAGTPGAQAPPPAPNAETVDTAKGLITKTAPVIEPRTKTAAAPKPAPAKPTETEVPVTGSVQPTEAAKPSEGGASKLEMIAAARQNPQLFAHLPERQRPSYLESEAEKLEREAEAYQQASKRASDTAAQIPENPQAVTRLEGVAKRNDDLAQSRLTEAAKKRAAADKLYEDAVGLKYEAAKARVSKGVESQFDLVDVIDENGATRQVPKNTVLEAQGAGLKAVSPGAGSPPGAAAVTPSAGPIKSEPEAVKTIRAEEQKMPEDYKKRVAVASRIDGLLDILTKYETGKFAEQKGDIVGKLNALGIRVDPTISADPAKFEVFMKSAIKNVFDDLPGGKILLAEIAGLSKANANSTMQPEANAKILGDAKAAINYENKYTLDYAKWRKSNPAAFSPTDLIEFNNKWLAQNKLDDFKKEAARNIGYVGQKLPSNLSEAQHGQAYYLPDQKEVRYLDIHRKDASGKPAPGFVKNDPLAGNAGQ